MRKKWFLVGITLLLVPWLVVGCGIAQEQYDAVVADLSKAQQEVQSVKQEVQSVKGELAAAQAKVSEMTSSLEEAKTELETAQVEQEAFKSDLKSSLDLLDGYLVLNSAILDIAEALPDDLDTVERVGFAISAEVALLGDPEAQALWEEAFVVDGGQWNLFFEPFETFIDKNLDRIASKMKELGDKLAE